MSYTLQRSTQTAQYIMAMAPQWDQRTGQVLFNILKHEIAEVVKGTNIDTFYRDMSLEEIIDWLERHIIYNDGGDMVCLFDKDTILWEEKVKNV